MDSMENLEWLAFSRGAAAFREYLGVDLPWFDSEEYYKRFMIYNPQIDKSEADNEFQRWRDRGYVKNMRRKALEEGK